MRRRRALQGVAAIVATGIAGCSGDRTGGRGTPTATEDLRLRSPTRQRRGATLDYLVRNDDDQTHRLGVLVEDAEGTIVSTWSDTEFEPGEQLGTAVPGFDPDRGPFPITVRLQSVSETIEWDADECPRFDLLVVVTSDGRLEVEREKCIS